MPAVATVLPRRSAGSAIPASGSEISEVSGLRDERADRDHRQALVAGEQHLGLVGDREVGAAGGDLADRRRGVGGDLGLDVEPGLVEVAAVERRVDPGVVGVDVEVERQVERLRSRRWRLSCFSPQPAASAPRRARASASRTPRHAAARRSVARAPPGEAPLDQRQAAEQGDRQRREDDDRGEHPRRLQLALGDQDQVAEALVGARPLAEDGADHRRPRPRSSPR